VSPDQTNRVTGLFLAWDPDAAGPAHHRLAAALRGAVNDGRLRPGDRLPPSRVLADELGLSRWVVTEAYDQLKAEGYLTGRVGSGTVVAGPPGGVVPGAVGPAGAAGAVAPSAPAASVGSSAARASVGSVGSVGQLAPVGSGRPDHGGVRVPLDLSPALPDLASFPRVEWRAALTRAIGAVSDAGLGYPDPAGAPALRTTIADYLRRVRGLEVDAEHVHVTQGVRNAVALVCRALRARGARRVAVEDPSWPGCATWPAAAGWTSSLCRWTPRGCRSACSTGWTSTPPS